MGQLLRPVVRGLLHHGREVKAVALSPDRGQKALIAAVKGDPAVASVWARGVNVMTEPAITLELRDRRRALHTRLTVAGTSPLAAAPLAVVPDNDEGPADVLARIHRPTGPGPGGAQR